MNSNASVITLEQEDVKTNDSNKALTTVLTYIVTDAFDLSDEESLWIGYNLSGIMQQMEGFKPDIVLSAVSKEIRSKEYTKRLLNRSSKGSISPIQSGVAYALLDDWSEVLSEIVLTSYPNARPMIRSSVIGGIYGLLMELGLTNNPNTCRSSRYLPNNVRYYIKSNS